MNSLKTYNSFGVDVACHELLLIHEIHQLIDFLMHNESPFIILGGGSNVLFTQDFLGTVLVNRLSGIEVKHLDDERVLVTAGGGVLWDDLVSFCVSKSYHGIENLTAIPGTVGAAPMQNIGAYGVELAFCFHSLKALNLSTKGPEVFDKTQCEFGYRSSVFKTRLKNKYFITSVSLVLQKKASLNLTYTPVKEAIDSLGIKQPTLVDVKNIINDIRWSKLPKPSELGNAGSFFKNPVIDKAAFNALLMQYPNIPHYLVDEGVKIPAGWLIEQCGWKGKIIGNTGSHAKQSLVIVNYGQATGAEIIAHAQRVQSSVLERFNIKIEAEVNIY